MAKVITFSRFFPAYHPRKGEPTFFVEKIWKHLYDLPGLSWSVGPYQQEYDNHFSEVFGNRDHIVNIHEFQPKHHTIRGGNRWEAGDKFSPRVWSGKPYNSKQIQFAPDMEVKKVWRIDLLRNKVFINRKLHCKIWEYEKFESFASNDGLSKADLLDWFAYPKPLRLQQIICWNDSIEY